MIRGERKYREGERGRGAAGDLTNSGWVAAPETAPLARSINLRCPMTRRDVFDTIGKTRRDDGDYDTDSRPAGVKWD